MKAGAKRTPPTHVADDTSGKTWRDNVTVMVLTLTLLVSIVTGVVVHLDGERALKAAHEDAVEALERAHKDAQDAIQKAHQDTRAALAQAQVSNEIAEQGLTSVQRAFVSVDELRATATTTADGETAILYTPVIRNSGDTPAFIEEYIAISPGNIWLYKHGFASDYQAMVAAWVLKSPSDPARAISTRRTHSDLDPAALARSDIFLGPKGVLLPIEGFGAERVTPSQIDRAGPDITRDRVLFFAGAIRYRDAFGGMHMTKYCYQIDRVELPGADNKSLTVARCSHWNCADGSCRDDAAQYATELADFLHHK